jgi:hypothetical protein
MKWTAPDLPERVSFGPEFFPKSRAAALQLPEFETGADSIKGTIDRAWSETVVSVTSRNEILVLSVGQNEVVTSQTSPEIAFELLTREILAKSYC